MENTQFILKLSIVGKFDSKEQYAVETMVDQKTALNLAADITSQVAKYLDSQTKAVEKKEKNEKTK